MRVPKLARIFLVTLLPLVPALAGPEATARGSSSRMANLPQTFLWAWERPEDLRFIDPQQAGVAFLAATVSLQGADVAVRPRLQPIRLPSQATLIAVVRIEATRPVALSAEQRERTVRALLAAALLPNVAALQVDFDATRSQIAFYRNVLSEVRLQLPEMAVSITALASWCQRESWLDELPIDEAVPMLFRMGTGTPNVIANLNSGKDFASPRCRSSLGLSTDEPWAALRAGRRIYFFHPKRWTAQAHEKALAEVRAWN